jgi:hypothetical protein
MFTEEQELEIRAGFRNLKKTGESGTGPCPSCGGKLRVKLLGYIGQQHPTADAHCDDCGERRDIDWV